MTSLGVLLAAALMFTTTGCSGQTGQQITVKEPPVQEKSENLVLEEIKRLDGVYGMAWLSDEEILTTSAPKWMEGELSTHDVQTGKDHPIGIASGMWVNLSPDRKYAYIYENSRMQASFVRMADGKRVRVQMGDGDISILNGQVQGAWLDNQTYVIATVQGLSQATLDGKVTPVAILGEQETVVKVLSAPSSSSQKLNRLYYLNNHKQLYVLPINSGTSDKSENAAKATLVQSQVVDFTLSPDGTQAAFAIETKENENALVVTKLDQTKQGKVITSGRFVRQLSWSPDGSKLAFALFNLERGTTGLYVMNTLTGYMTPVSYYPNLQSVLWWSPSGKQLMMSQENQEMNLDTPNSKLLTEMYRLK
jgi:hypothetical protein